MSVTAPVAVIGTGSIGIRHLHVLRALGASPIAVPMRSERLQELAHLGFPSVASIAELRRYSHLRSIVATDTARHVSDALQLLPLGDVLVEKPVATSASELKVLSEAASHSPHRVSVAYCLRHDDGLLLFRRRLPEIGPARSVRIDSQSYLPDWRPARDYRESYSARPDEGGVIRDLSHELDYALWLFGRPERVVCQAGCSASLGIAAIDFADLSWQTPSGAAVTVRLDYLTRMPRRSMTAIGERGCITWDAVARTVTVRAGSGVEEISVTADRNAMYTAQARCFLDGSGAGATLSEGAAVVALIEAAHASAQSGTAVALKMA